MLRDDAIRAGLIVPSKEDKKRMCLTDKDLQEIRDKLKKNKK